MNVLRTLKKNNLYSSNISEDYLLVIYAEIKVSKRFSSLSQILC